MNDTGDSFILRRVKTKYLYRGIYWCMKCEDGGGGGGGEMCIRLTIYGRTQLLILSLKQSIRQQ